MYFWNIFPSCVFLVYSLVYIPVYVSFVCVFLVFRCTVLLSGISIVYLSILSISGVS